MPLSPTAVDLIRQALKLSGKYTKGVNDKPVFASRFERLTALARHSLSQAVRRILTISVTRMPSRKFTPHDLRRTGATLAQSLRIQRDYVKALLNHKMTM